MHFESDPEELSGWILGTIFGLAGMATLVVLPAWICVGMGELNVGIPLLIFPIAAFLLQASRIFLAPQVSVDLERSPRTAHVVRMNLLTRRKRKRSYPLPDDACVILEVSDCVYSLTIRRAFLRHIYLTQPRDGDAGRSIAVEVAMFLGVELEHRL